MTTILSVRGLAKYFLQRGSLFRRGAPLKALDGVSFDVLQGEAFGIVGESGSGKTTLGRIVAGLLAADGGAFEVDGRDAAAALAQRTSTVRRAVQMVFQDPHGSLNPRRTIGQTLAEPLRVHRVAARGEVDAHVRERLAEVGLPPDAAAKYPHQFSGGQKQRVGIARALLLSPRLLVADEPVSALDVSVQAQILQMLKSLQARHQLAVLFISHDLAVVRYFCDRVGVLYLGRLVELGPARAVFDRPLHPYTAMLRAACPTGKPAAAREPPAPAGEVATALDVPTGCAFHPRCMHAQAICRAERPEFREVEAGRWSACHFAERIAADAPLGSP